MIQSRNIAPPLITCVIVVCLLTAVYAAGYFRLGTASYCKPANETIRVYDSGWAAAIYKPAGKIEQACADYKVTIIGPDGR